MPDRPITLMTLAQALRQLRASPLPVKRPHKPISYADRLIAEGAKRGVNYGRIRPK